MIAPHGGRLVNRMVDDAERARLRDAAAGMPKVVLNARETADLDMIAVGAMSPLHGFLVKEEYDSVLADKRLRNGLPWAIPIVLAVKPGANPDDYQEDQDVALVTEGGEVLAVLHVESKWQSDKGNEARTVLLTDDEAHPGVQYLQSIGDWYLGELAKAIVDNDASSSSA